MTDTLLAGAGKGQHYIFVQEMCKKHGPISSPKPGNMPACARPRHLWHTVSPPVFRSFDVSVATDITQLIGNTPLLLLREVSASTGCTIYGKAEFLNPGSSSRIAPRWVSSSMPRTGG